MSSTQYRIAYKNIATNRRGLTRYLYAAESAALDQCQFLNERFPIFDHWPEAVTVEPVTVAPLPGPTESQDAK